MAISILLVRGLLEALERYGIKSAQLFAATAFDACRVEDPDGRVTLEEFDDLHEHALDLTGDPDLGLRLGEQASPSTYSLVAYLFVHARTLRDGIEALGRYHRLLADSPALKLVEAGAEATLLYEVAPGSARCRRLRAEVALAGFYRMIRYFARNGRPTMVAFEHPAPARRDEYDRIFEGTARFEQSFSGVVFDRALLSVQSSNCDADLHAALEHQAERRLSRLDRNATYAERVREALTERGAMARTDMGSVARALGLSIRSLRRRLSEEGASYYAILDAALAAQAKQLLADEARSIQETAYYMGFAEPSAFHRAFKRWTGTTPTAFRMAHGVVRGRTEGSV